MRTREGTGTAGVLVGKAGVLDLTSRQRALNFEPRAEFLRCPDRRLSVAVFCTFPSSDPDRLVRAVADVPIGPDQFRLGGSSIVGTFDRSAGAVTLRLSGPGEGTFTRQPRWRPTAVELAPFVGSYYSTELAVQDTLSMDGAGWSPGNASWAGSRSPRRPIRTGSSRRGSIWGLPRARMAPSMSSR